MPTPRHRGRAMLIDLSLVSVEELLDELAPRFDGRVFLGRVITN
jgi:hypothetical protein